MIGNQSFDRRDKA